MATKKQIAANRRNAKKSTGPRTPAGLAVSRFNALRSGLRVSTEYLPAESWQRLLEIRRRFLHEWQPQTPDRRRLVARVACAVWKLLECRETHAEILRQAAEASSPRRQDRLRARLSLREAHLELVLRNAYHELVKSIPSEPPEFRPAA